MVKNFSAPVLVGLLLLSMAAACRSDGGAPDAPATDPAAEPSTVQPADLEPFEATGADGGRHGYRDATGRVVIEPRFLVADPFSDFGLAAVVDDSGWAYIDARGEVVVRPFVFDNGPDPFSEGLARFEQEGRLGFFDERGTVAIEPRFDFARPFSEGLAAACMGCVRQDDGEHQLISGGRWGYIDRQGEEAIPFVFDEAGSFEGGRARVVEAGESKSIGKDGRPAR